MQSHATPCPDSRGSQGGGNGGDGPFSTEAMLTRGTRFPPVLEEGPEDATPSPDALLPPWPLQDSNRAANAGASAAREVMGDQSPPGLDGSSPTSLQRCNEVLPLVRSFSRFSIS